MITRNFFFSILTTILFTQFNAGAIQPHNKTLPRELASFEKPVVADSRATPGPAPMGHVHSLGEWEQADSVMTLWSNSSYIKALSENGKVTLLADNEAEKSRWKTWLKDNKISDAGFSYFTIPTDSIWVRDYGPWWILDGDHHFGIVDTTYNRPRPQDDKVPGVIGKLLNIPVYNPELIHTGGNYYSDGMGNAFSSTLVFKENKNIGNNEVLNRMLSFLGIDKYTTSALGENATIEHLDTFGKLVAPDTWVYSDFPADSAFKADSDRMVKLLSNMRSPYGNNYKIFRMPMVANSRGSNYRAYINSFISNGVLYFPTYGEDAYDKKAKEIYQQALPGYKIVGVKNQDTSWGDSVHCRSRNLITSNTIFIFPKILQQGEQVQITAEVIPSPGAQLVSDPQVVMQINGHTQTISMTSKYDNQFYSEISGLKQGDALDFYITASDSSGKVKSAPIMAPEQRISWQVQ